ncbi:MAG: 3-deoxy-manno-octulosonate cytidylyltransferase [Opitutales bacterium]
MGKLDLSCTLGASRLASSSANYFFPLPARTGKLFSWGNLFSMSDLVIIAPARLDSKRFPRKLLYPVRGKPLILWTADRLTSEAPEYPLHFAVADEELNDVLKDAGYQAHLTDPALPTGTDRVAALNAELGASMVINAQADEPLVTRGQLASLAELLGRGSEMCTLACPFDSEDDFRDPNQVKVVLDQEGRALYFSRSAIPFHRGEAPWIGPGRAFRHLGVYGYSGEFLHRYVSFPQTALEQSERLEQLRALENGHPIEVALTEEQTLGIDVLTDVTRFETFLENR